MWTDNGVCKAKIGETTATAAGASFAPSVEAVVTSAAAVAEQTAAPQVEKGKAVKRSRFFRL